MGNRQMNMHNMRGCVMELTEKEADLIASMRKSQPPPWPTKRCPGRPVMQYPHVYPTSAA